MLRPSQLNLGPGRGTTRPHYQ